MPFAIRLLKILQRPNQVIHALVSRADLMYTSAR
jgi:hypothetical protein